ncbi:MAG: radical SAM protein [Candidatus Sumerlaeota bacterium]|nr:radical SAM protein [Candidatus Sumerlaeota bacterium]
MTRSIEKVVLLIPNSRWAAGSRPWRINPYSICMVAAGIKDRYETVILDANLEDLTMEQTAERIERLAPQVVGLTVISIEYAESAHQAAAAIKTRCPQVALVFGGVYPTVLPEIAMRDANVDYVVLSEGDYRFRQLLEAVEKGALDSGSSATSPSSISRKEALAAMDGLAWRNDGRLIIQPVRQFIQNLDALPFPAYDLVDFHAYSGSHSKFDMYNDPRFPPMAVTVSSRGCPFKCVFCGNKPLQGTKWRMKSAENVLAEMDWLIERYGIKEIAFLDDNLLLDRERILTIMRGIIERGLYWRALTIPVFSMDDEIIEMIHASGCDRVILPIESGNQHVLTNIVHKPLKLEQARRVIAKCKEVGLTVFCGFVIGFPGETWDQILDTVRFADEADVDYVIFSIATPLPAAPLYELAQSLGCLDPDFSFSDFRFFGFGRGAITTDEFTPQELQTLRAFEWDRINFKTRAKAEKIARMNSITMEELRQWRVNTRRASGIGVKLDS